MQCSDVNFLNVCLETSRNIMQRKKIYKKDYDFILISLRCCSEMCEQNKEDERYKKLYKKFLVVLDIAYNKFNGFY